MNTKGLWLALILGACTSVTEGPDTITINSGYGGAISYVHSRYKEIEATGKPVVVDGRVASADAFFAFGLPDVCYTDNAVWSPHAASALGLFPWPRVTRLLTRQLPAPLAEWFSNSTAYYNWITWPTVKAEQLKEIWPEGAC